VPRATKTISKNPQSRLGKSVGGFDEFQLKFILLWFAVRVFFIFILFLDAIRLNFASFSHAEISMEAIQNQKEETRDKEEIDPQKNNEGVDKSGHERNEVFLPVA
jgi:acid phosphatase family membrane protein YuiD